MFAFRVRGSAELLVALTGGAVMGVALVGLLPEALDVGRPHFTPFNIAALMAAGLGAYLLADRLAAGAGRKASARGHAAAATLTAHSFMDGLGAGLAFHVSLASGLIVAAAVLAHDALDGLNTVTVSLQGGVRRRTAMLWLALDAAAPLVGIWIASQFAVPRTVLAPLLAIFAGFFLYIGAHGVLGPQGSQGRLATTFATLAGFAIVYGAVSLAGG
jgi:ZIP family zinc transporter